MGVLPRPQMRILTLVEVTYLTWTDDNLLRHLVFNGVREDKPAQDVVRPIPHPGKVPAGNEREAAQGRAGWLDRLRLRGQQGSSG